jgi:hypothetical protein
MPIVTVARGRKRLTSARRIIASAPAGRIRVTASKKGPLYMPRGNDFSPMDANETVTLTFDFGPWLASGVTISSITDLSCAVFKGTDADADTRLVGSAQTASSPTTGAAQAAVLQQIGNSPVTGVIYRIDAVVVTSDNQTLNLYAHQAVETPN